MKAGTSDHLTSCASAETAHSPLGAGEASESGLYTALCTDLSETQKLKLELNEQLEIELGVNLEHHCLDIARRMAEVIGGFQDYAGAMDYIRHNLETKIVDWDQYQRDCKERIQLGLEGPPAMEVVGDERDLLLMLQAAYGDRYKTLYDYVYGVPASVEACRAKLSVLKTLKPLFDGHNPVRNGPGAPEATAREHKKNRKLFRKVYYSLKLWEMLESQMGYFDGSLAFKGGVKTDLEYWVYLISTKTRSPKHQLLTNAPKSMKRYRTSEKTLLPIYNQPSLSKGHAEFISARDFPLLVKAEIQGRLTQAVATAGGKDQIKALAPGLTDEQVGDLDLVVGKIVDENKRKTFYTDILKLSWSDVKYDAGENPFKMSDYLAAHLKPTDIKDERLFLEAAQSNLDVLERLRDTETRVNVVGRKANIMITPLSAIMEFAAKLNSLTVDELEVLYATSLGERSDKAALIDSALQDGFEAMQRWYLSAMRWAKPIYSGPSGHALGYLNLYAKAYDRDGAIKAAVAMDLGDASGRIGPREKPSLEQARLVMLCALIGKKQHHSYDEVMIASHGLTTQSDQRHENTLSYRHPYSYADIAQSGDPAAIEALNQAIATVLDRAAKTPKYAAVLPEWLDEVVADNCFPVIKDVPALQGDIRIGAPVDLNRARANLTWKAVEVLPRTDRLLAEDEDQGQPITTRGRLRVRCIDSDQALHDQLVEEMRDPLARGDGGHLEVGSYLDHISCNKDLASVIFLYDRHQITATAVNDFALTTEAKAMLSTSPARFREQYGDYFVAGTRNAGRLAIVVNIRRSDLGRYRASDWTAPSSTFADYAKRIRAFVEACGDATINVREWGFVAKGHRWYTVTKPDFYTALQKFAEMHDRGEVELDECAFVDLVHYSQIAPGFPAPEAVDLPLALGVRRISMWAPLVQGMINPAQSTWQPTFTDKDHFLRDAYEMLDGHLKFMNGHALVQENVDFIEQYLLEIMPELMRRRSLRRIGKWTLDRSSATGGPNDRANQNGFCAAVDSGILIEVAEHQRAISLDGPQASRMLVTDTVTVAPGETIIGCKAAPDMPGQAYFTPDPDMIGRSTGNLRLDGKAGVPPQNTRWLIRYWSIVAENFKRL